MYVFSQFEQILTNDKKHFDIYKPLTTSDCEFLRKLGIPARLRQLRLTVTFPQKDVIQEYGILFKLLSGKIQPMK